VTAPFTLPTQSGTKITLQLLSFSPSSLSGLGLELPLVTIPASSQCASAQTSKVLSARAPPISNCDVIGQPVLCAMWHPPGAVPIDLASTRTYPAQALLVLLPPHAFPSPTMIQAILQVPPSSPSSSAPLLTTTAPGSLARPTLLSLEEARHRLLSRRVCLRELAPVPPVQSVAEDHCSQSPPE
jgi:hypothetical protein